MHGESVTFSLTFRQRWFLDLSNQWRGELQELCTLIGRKNRVHAGLWLPVLRKRGINICSSESSILHHRSMDLEVRHNRILCRPWSRKYDMISCTYYTFLCSSTSCLLLTKARSLFHRILFRLQLLSQRHRRRQYAEDSSDGRSCGTSKQQFH